MCGWVSRTLLRVRGIADPIAFAIVARLPIIGGGLRAWVTLLAAVIAGLGFDIVLVTRLAPGLVVQGRLAPRTTHGARVICRLGTAEDEILAVGTRGPFGGT